MRSPDCSILKKNADKYVEQRFFFVPLCTILIPCMTKIVPPFLISRDELNWDLISQTLFSFKGSHHTDRTVQHNSKVVNVHANQIANFDRLKIISLRTVSDRDQQGRTFHLCNT
jgi:hypothetical protein